MTPYELSIIIEITNEKRQMENDNNIALVWMGENLHRYKKLPSLDKLLNGENEPIKKQMTDDEMLEQVKKLNALFGGTVE
ncbi:hypothetical protein V7152_14980 [Neobacillus drentensis]|uniref:hypothetical protein n=1 Tax=Neobacillus drentensis TaxID=220684 RepID=UPI0030001601